jgi:hypothetical protein
MSILNRIACLQDSRDEVPNQELARELAAAEDMDGIKEIEENLFNRDKRIQSNCIKVLYEIGYIKPQLISQYTEDFMKLIKSSNNRLVWGAMIALAMVAEKMADEIYQNLETVYSALKQGSVITMDNGIKVLTSVASKNEKYNKSIFPYLIDHLKMCKPRDVARHAESSIAAVNVRNKNEFMKVLKEREVSLKSSELARVKKLYKASDKIPDALDANDEVRL